ncbi:transcriptional regulator [Nonomuraea sp. WAC 01424]|uniref:AfsR/SARP family transcriptional regulator n=1 Tax=Nonomuraea sp. WAC 01424 TaxID=2203200 RepID=UPI000F7A7E61|nr:BTAD domain-containing putative transcriptional regulator [Nonomuraea sp. WAC 01424]RSN15542.1 transcriptional regulator [Nonomuraea sp. WAC 01424]
MTAHIEFRVLGPLAVGVRDRPVRLRGLRQRSLLAALLLDAGRVVSVDRLAAAVWGEHLPDSVRTQISIHVHGLRKAFKDAGCGVQVIVTEQAGYRLHTDGVWLDTREAEELAAEARKAAAAGLGEQAAAMLARVLGLWRGPVLGEIDTTEIATVARGLEDARLGIAEEWAEAELACGRPREVVARLAGLVEDHPLREGLRAQLMLALWHSERQADALESYQRGRRHLLEELGVEPGRGLREVQQAILAGPPACDAMQPEVPTPPAARLGGNADDGPLPADAGPVVTVRPAQLPPPVSAFVGRTSQIRTLDRILRQDGRCPPMGVISGVAGAGKTALALQWAHLVADRFPDGQLFANLRGYDPDRESAQPAAVLERFLRALGVDGTAIPAGAEERTALFRSILDGRQVLVVLDNAESAAQVRPLLPATPGCCVIVTSRRRLEGLLMGGALAVPVEVLTEQDSAELLARVLGAERVAAEPETVAELAALCDGSPLALRIAAAKLAMRPQWSVGEMAERLADERSRLDQLSRGGLEVRASIGLSYRELSARAALAFRRLGLMDAPGGYAPWLMAALLDTTVHDGERLLEELVDAQLLQPLGRDEAGQPRYRFHDLIRLYAREQAETVEPPDARTAVLSRALGALLGLAEQARDLLHSRYPMVPRGDSPRWLPEDASQAALTDDPLAWLESERLNLVSAVTQSAQLRLADLCRDLAASFVHMFVSRAYFDDWRTVATRALEACRAASHLPGQAAMLFSLGSLALSQRRLTQAADLLETALELFQRLADVPSQAIVLRHLGTVHLFQGDLDRGREELEQALALFEQVGDITALAHGLGFLSHAHMLQDRLEEAARLLHRALTLNPGSKRTEAQLLKRLAEVYRRQGRHADAIRKCEGALAHAVDLNDLVGQAYVLHALGETQLDLGEIVEAGSTLHQALHLARRVGDRLIEGRVLLALGHLGSDRSTFHLQQAAETFAAIGAAGWHDKAMRAAARVSA